MAATESQRREKYERRAQRLTKKVSTRPKRELTDKQQAIRAARSELDKELAKIEAKYRPKIAELLEEFAGKQRKARADHDRRVELIKQAHLLGG